MVVSAKVDSESVNSLQALPEIWQVAAQKFGQKIALNAPHLKPKVSISYQELAQKINEVAIALQTLGVQPQEKIALFADNSPRWLIADQGIMQAGAVNVVRSSTAETQELAYIFQDSDSVALVAENQKTLEKLTPEIKDCNLKFVILLSDEEIKDNNQLDCQILNFSQLLELGKGKSLQSVEQGADTLATLIYTSGTTGKPKGAMLSHGNLLHQVKNLDAILLCQPGDRVLSILPSWHAYERSAEYFLLSRGCTQYYTNLRSLKADLKKYLSLIHISEPTRPY